MMMIQEDFLEELKGQEVISGEPRNTYSEVRVELEHGRESQTWAKGLESGDTEDVTGTPVRNLG